MNTIKVRNLITNESFIFVNNYSLTENIVNAIISNRKQTGMVLDVNLRNKIKEESNIKESTSKLTTRPFAYSEKFDLCAKFENETIEEIQVCKFLS